MYYRSIEIYNPGILRAAENSHYANKNVPDAALCIEIYQGTTEIESGFFDVFENLAEISFARSVTKIGISDETLKILKKNNTVIKGYFDSCADKLAAAHNLPFIHADIPIGYRSSEYSIDHVTLCFGHDGSPYIHQNSVSPGMSASSAGGGENTIRLKKDFYSQLSQEDIADMCWGCCYSSIMEDEWLKAFLQKAIRRKGFKRNI